MLHTDRLDLLLSLVHTLFAITVLPVLHYVSSSHPFDLCRNDPATSYWQSAALLVSVAYYVYDSIDMLQHEPAPLLPPSVCYLLHHAICVGGLLTPVVCGVDGSLVLLGLLIGELSNPPRLYAQLVARQLARHHKPPSVTRLSSQTLPHPSQLRGPAEVQLWVLHSTLSSVHFMLFVATRVLGVWYYAAVLWPCSASVWTAVWAGAMCVFSVCTVLVYVLWSDGVSIATTALERRSDTVRESHS